MFSNNGLHVHGLPVSGVAWLYLPHYTPHHTTSFVVVGVRTHGQFQQQCTKNDTIYQCRRDYLNRRSLPESSAENGYTSLCEIRNVIDRTDLETLIFSLTIVTIRKWSE